MRTTQRRSRARSGSAAGSPARIALDAARAMDALRRIVRALQHAARVPHGRRGVSGAQHFVLRQLAAAPGMSLTELAERTLTRASTLSEVVSRLTAAGLVRRAPTRGDARRVALVLTARGAAAAEAGGPGVPQRLADALVQLRPGDLAGLAHGLEEWVAAAGLVRTPATMFLEPPPPKSGRRRQRTATRQSRDGGARA